MWNMLLGAKISFAEHSMLSFSGPENGRRQIQKKYRITHMQGNPQCTFPHHCHFVRGSYSHGPLTRYVKLRVAHTPGMPGTFSPPPRVSDPGMRHGACATHVPWCMPGSLASGFLWNQRRGKRSRHPRRMRNHQFYVSGKRSIGILSSSRAS